MEPKRLYRSLTDRKLAGVAGGLGEYFDMDPLLIRLAFVVLALAGGGGVLIYIVLWIVTPENPLRYQPNAAQPGPGPQPGPYETREQNSDPSRPEYNAEPTPTQPVIVPKEHSKGSLIGGLVLITLGALFLADELIPRISFGDLWPLLLVVIGLGLLFNAVAARNRNINK